MSKSGIQKMIKADSYNYPLLIRILISRFFPVFSILVSFFSNFFSKG
jgi:hypothetical protein